MSFLKQRKDTKACRVPTYCISFYSYLPFNFSVKSILNTTYSLIRYLACGHNPVINDFTGKPGNPASLSMSCFMIDYDGEMLRH